MRHGLKAITAAAFLVFAAAPLSAGAITVTKGVGLLADFSLPIPPFTLPVALLDETVEFGPNYLNNGEGYATKLYDANGVLLNTSSYTNVAHGNIIGCACTGGYLDQPLTTVTGTFFLIATSGSFDVTNIYIYRPTINAIVSNIRSCSPFPGGGSTGGCLPGPGPFPAPEPGTLALLTLGMLGLGCTARRRLHWPVSVVRHRTPPRRGLCLCLTT